MPDLNQLQKIIGVTFCNRSLLERALVHTSYVNENPGYGSNERMEFLGDAVLGFIVAERLYRDYPDLNEGEMTKIRAAIVCKDCLSRVSGGIGLGDYLALGRGEDSSGGRGKPANLARAMEAVIAAVFLDGGMAVTGEFIAHLFDGEIRKAVARGLEIDYKSRLQELVQSKHRQAPAYRIVDAVGPDHDRIYTVEVMVGGVVMGRGSGKSKKTAENEAARVALESIGSR